LVFTEDGRQLISAAADQTIRSWDTSTWRELNVLRGHNDEVHSVATSQTVNLIASASKDGDLMLWRADAGRGAHGYTVLPSGQVEFLDHSRLLLLKDKTPELLDLKSDSKPLPLSELGSPNHVLGCFGTNVLCLWSGTNQIVVSALSGSEFLQLGTVTMDSDSRPAGLAYCVARQVLAWTESASSNSIFLASLAAPGHRVEFRAAAPGFVPRFLSEDGNYLVVMNGVSLRLWNIEKGQIVTSIDNVWFVRFALGGRMLIVATAQGSNHEIAFYNLADPSRAPRRVAGRHQCRALAVSADGSVVASATAGGFVSLFDAASGELIESVHANSMAAQGVAFSTDGRRFISSSNGRETIKLFDFSTRQELLTLSGTGSRLSHARWSADGDVIIAGTPWQAWRAPSWEEIAAAEAKEKAQNQQP
jgi:WD40 repeat protein